MGLSLGDLYTAIVLFINALAILNENRFLKRVGLGPQETDTTFGTGSSPKAQFINLLNAVRTLMRVPLIAVNSITIIYFLILG